ncbi:tetraspanin-1-like [Neoarius graeffei]|uniref:tetraspanin-1-like n=1 Tax=Neoarius graeffei TaxID=443677 RepID=UPI00298CF3B8|nr:tetraspanin-1-like [Neoarius graeffei]
MACEGILRVLMVLFNSVIFTAGVATVAIGVLVEINRKFIFGVLEHIKDVPTELAHLANTGYLLIAVGVILAFMGFLGCCGACCKNKCMLMTFFIIILIVFIAEVAAAVLILLYQPTAEKLLDKLREEVAKNIKEDYGQNDIVTNAWNETMSLLKCCGYTNYTDFTGSPFVKRTSQYPQFCCSPRTESCDGDKATSAHVVGCFDAVVKLVKSNSTLLAGVAVCVAAIEVAAMIVSLILYKN